MQSLNKTKAALQGRLSHFSDIAENNSTLIDQVNASRFAHIFSGCGKSTAVTAPALARPDSGRVSLIRWFYSASMAPSKVKGGVSIFGHTPKWGSNSLIFSRNAIGDTGITVSGERHRANGIELMALTCPPLVGSDLKSEPQFEVILEIRYLPIPDPERSDGYSCEVSLVFLRWRRLISLSRAVTTNCPVLSPSAFRFSIASTKQSGTRASIRFDLAFTDLVAIFGFRCIWCPTIIIERKYNSSLDVSHTLLLACVPHLDFDKVRNGNAPDCRSSTEASNHNVRWSNIMACIQHTQTHPKFTWRFLAIDRADMAAKPCRLSVEAATEKDARRVLAPHFILSLAARLPVVEVRHA